MVFLSVLIIVDYTKIKTQYIILINIIKFSYNDDGKLLYISETIRKAKFRLK